MSKYIIFDLDDTLLDFQKGEVEGVKKILKTNGVADIHQGFSTYQTINQKVWQQIESGVPRQPLLDTRFSKTLALFDIDANGVKLEAEYREMLNHNFYTLPGAAALLDSLKQNDFILFVGTNGVKKTQFDRLEGSGLLKYFDDYFISEDIGFSKPSTEFFSPIFKKYQQLTRENTFMIGDRLQSDILGANRVGLRSIWYNPNEMDNTFDYQPTYTANSYDQIKQILL